MKSRDGEEGRGGLEEGGGGRGGGSGVCVCAFTENRVMNVARITWDGYAVSVELYQYQKNFRDMEVQASARAARAKAGKLRSTPHTRALDPDATVQPEDLEDELPSLTDPAVEQMKG